MATKSIDEMSFAEKVNAVRDAKITPEERNEIYNAWSKDAGYEKVLFNKITFVKQHSSINHYGNQLQDANKMQDLLESLISIFQYNFPFSPLYITMKKN